MKNKLKLVFIIVVLLVMFLCIGSLFFLYGRIATEKTKENADKLLEYASTNTEDIDNDNSEDLYSDTVENNSEITIEYEEMEGADKVYGSVPQGKLYTINYDLWFSNTLDLSVCGESMYQETNTYGLSDGDLSPVRYALAEYCRDENITEVFEIDSTCVGNPAFNRITWRVYSDNKELYITIDDSQGLFGIATEYVQE